MSRTRFLREPGGRAPALDMAISQALLEAVARGAPGVLRLFRPAPTLAFGRLDALRPGFPEARAAAERHGFAPVLRLAGGHAAAYHEQCLVYEEIRPAERLHEGLEERFAGATALLAGALAARGADVRVGPVAGEYCAGRHSVNLGGRVKVVGVAQRAIRGASLLSAFVIAGGGDAVRAVLTDVYAALALDWDPGTAGALDLDVAAVAAAVRAAAARREPLVEADLEAAVEGRALALAGGSMCARTA
jgi:octanoyl-[GcvH]:protein N-octanoyltransferase